MQRVTFRCKRSGNLVHFTDEQAISSLRALESYEEVKPVGVLPGNPELRSAQAAPVEAVEKQRGRPRKSI